MYEQKYIVQTKWEKKEKGTCRCCGRNAKDDPVVIPSIKRMLCIPCDWAYDRWYGRRKKNDNLRFKTRNAKGNIRDFCQDFCQGPQSIDLDYTVKEVE